MPIPSKLIVPALVLIVLGCAPPPPQVINREVSQSGTISRNTSVKIAQGSLRGFVTDATGQPVGGAGVRIGPVLAHTANPLEADVKSEADPRSDGRTMTVMHDFGDGKGAVLAVRRPLIKSIGETKYVYLRAGEYLIEGLSPGTVSVLAFTIDAASPSIAATIVKDKITEAEKLVIPFGSIASPSPSVSPSASASPSGSPSPSASATAS